MDSNEKNIGRWSDDQLASLRSNEEWTPDTTRGLSLLREKRAAAGLRSKQRAWAAVAVLTACAGLVAFPVTRAFAQRCVDACVAETSRVSGFFFRGSTIPDSPSAGIVASSYRRASERKMAPDFTLSDVAGKTVKLSDFRGQVVLLNFWATWCAPCKIEIPWFMEFERSYRDRSFAVLGVSFDDDGWKAVKPYMELRKINYPMVIGNDEVSGLFGGITAMPTTLLIDKDGRIAVTHVGLCSKKDYESEITTLLEEKQ